MAKRELANSRPKDVDELMGDVQRSIHGIGSSAKRLCGCFPQSQPPFFADRLHFYAEINKLPKSHVAEALGIGQDGASRLEQRCDFLNSTLRSYIETTGGVNCHASRVFRVVSG